MGLDSQSYAEYFNYEMQINDPIRCPYEYLAGNSRQFIKLYIDSAMILRSAEIILSSWFKETEAIDIEVYYKYGYGLLIPKNKFDWSKATPAVGRETYIDKTLDFVHDIVNICRKNEIELILFTLPMNHITYIASVSDKNYFEFLEGLAEIAEFWNFSSLNDIP